MISGCAIGSAILLAHIASRVITDPAARNLGRWVPALSILFAVWAVRAGARWVQARLGQHGASAVITDLSGRVLTAVTARQPRQLAVERDAAAAVVTRGLDALRPYFTAYLPALLLAAILTPVSAAVLGLYDLKSAVIVVITLPLIPIFMVLIGLATADRSATALAAMATLQARLLDLIAGIPTLRALGRASGPERRISELAAAHRRSAMATLRIAFLSALVLELLATLGVAMVAVSIGLRLVFGEISLTAGLTVLLLAPDVYWPLRRMFPSERIVGSDASADTSYPQRSLSQLILEKVPLLVLAAVSAVITLRSQQAIGRMRQRKISQARRKTRRTRRTRSAFCKAFVTPAKTPTW